MATHVYACLLGDWVNLSEEPDCGIGKNRIHPSIWWEEGADIWSPFQKERKDSLYEHDYLNVYYKGKNYRISPLYLQIVSD